MTSLALSVLLALASAVCYAAGAILQEHVAATTPRLASAPLRRGSWWTAVTLNGTGAVLHVIALAYGPLSVVQPLGALTIVFALPMAALFVRRRVGAAGWRGALLATAGLAGLLSLTGSSRAQALAERDGFWLIVITVSVIAVLIGAARLMRSPGIRSVLLAAAAGTAFGVSSVVTKNVAVEWTWDAWQDALPGLVTIGLLASGGVLLSQASYRGAGLASPLATATVVNPVVATAVGIAALGEHFRHGAPGTLLALVAALVASTGLVMLTVHNAEAEAESEAAAKDAEDAEVTVVEEPGAPGHNGRDAADGAGGAGGAGGPGVPEGPGGPGPHEVPVGPDVPAEPGPSLRLPHPIPRQPTGDEEPDPHLSDPRLPDPRLPDCGEAVLQHHA
ncbi:DMT family transporter [Streptomyces rapamycinicus]|uniref:Membrane protein n=2 Tax=Streptomyces rapamycinicus TaxID=1226757 RepID=A0A3L8R7Q1_STRRN|nr:DMT family transporter [Streptomyces rapamycinicus]MBB4780435.1 drug/metabolite transporter (DMT)-like permease [Streptomyces rapamycinicus]RLV74912.1 membrane protein [Streptomyces rapamycinicus NRRL 5491]UTO61161.1 DMT family transporter [Streptomyces rapamycinicus]UTP29106.1 DMT family transporter [Streptomyces rapamycinicus NRRL 5491]